MERELRKINDVGEILSKIDKNFSNEITRRMNEKLSDYLKECKERGINLKEYAESELPKDGWYIIIEPYLLYCPDEKKDEAFDALIKLGLISFKIY